MNKIFRIVWSQATQSWVAVSELTKAHKKQSSSNSLKAVVGTAAVLLSINTAQAAVAIGETTANNTFTQSSAQATGDNAVAIGKGSKATAGSAVALGEAANANQARAIAIGKGATIIGDGQDTIAIGTDTKAQGHNSIVIGKNAKTTNNAEGTVVIGRDAFSEGSGNGGRPNTVVGRGAYTAFGENGTYRLNAATALGFQAGAGLRTDPNNGNKLINNETNADNNAEVLVKAGYGLDEKAPADTKAALQGGNVNNNLTFYRRKHINEATAIGAEARAIGDQSIAIGGQVVAGDGVVALGGNDTDQLRNNKYQVVTDDAVNRTKVDTIDDYNLAYTESTNTVAGQYNKLVGRAMPTGYRSTYGQSGSVVIGMEAHSSTALGTAIGTNSVVRMGAFGATAIGAGSTVQANADAAVAIGMGSVANGAYALAGGTASWAEYGDIALGYQAKATGKDGAIAMGRATNAQGDSSIMIGGANIGSAAAQNTSFEKSNGTTTKKTVTEKINGADVKREYSFAGTTKTNGTVAEAYKELTGITMDTAALDFAKNKNGHASTSLGVHALSKGDLGTAIGAGSRSDAIGSVALGTGAHATRQNAVAIGTGSTTELVGTRQLSVSYNNKGEIVDDNSKDVAYTFNWAGGTNTAEGDVVSFGSSGAERQLKNVAAGRVAEDSTDAINGSQLNSISKKVALGWNIAGDPKTRVAGIGADDQVNFVNGNGTTVTVEKQDEVKSGDKVTTPKGANVKFDIKAADGSIASTADGISVNVDGDTIGKTADGKLKANTGTINTGNDGKAAPNTGDGNKLATVDTVVDAVNNAAWKATAGSDGSGTETGKSEEKIKAGDLVTFKAGDNLAIKQAGKDFIYSLNPVLTGLTSATFTNAAGDKTVINSDGMKITPKDAPANPVSLTKDGLDNGGKTIKNVTSGLTNYGPGTPKEGLVDLSKPATGNPTVPDTTAATVGDLRNMGWVVSSDKTTGELTKAYTDQVKNADEVKFVGEGGVTVSGKTENGVRTITVKAEAQEMPEQPVSYTTADGTKVYPKTVTKPDGSKETKYYPNPDGTGTEIPKENVIASINGPEGTKAPTTLSNVAGNLDGAKKDTKAPTTEHAPVNTTDAKGPNYVNPNNAATVGDVLNAGWNLQNNGEARDFVKPYDTVNFINGKGTVAVVETADDATSSTVKFDVDAGEITADENKPGAVKGPNTTGKTPTELAKNLADAQKAVDDLAKDPSATEDAKQKAQDALKAAQDESALLNKVATAQNVADMINNSGFTLKAGKTEGDNLTAADLANGEMINPGDTITMKAGKNMSVKHEKDGSITYATKDEVEFNTVKVGGDANTYVDDKGNPVTKKEDGSFEDAEGNKVAKDKVSPVAPVTLKTEKASPANNNAEGNHPTTALNIAAGDKPTQLKGVGSVLNTKEQPTSTGKQGDTPATAGNQNLVNLGNDPTTGNKSSLAPEILNSAATVGDLANMGWVVSTKDGNDYKDVVKNANQVDFKGTGLATVTGETKDGIRTITVNVDAQKTVEAAQNPVVYTDSEGNKVTKLGDNFYPVEEAKDAVKIGDNYYPAGTVLKDGKPVDSEGNEATALVPTDKKTVKASMNNGNNEAAPTVLSNVGSNLPTVDDVKKKAFEPNDSKNPLANKSNKAAPITALEAAELLDPTSNKFAGNNAATVSDVLNAGWNLQNNGEARDFVKPYDTVNFINGKGTVAVVETADDATSSTVKFDVDAGEITADENKPGAVKGPNTTGKTPTELAKNLADAQKAVDDLAKDPSATEDAKQKAQDALKAAQDESALLNKVATAQNVADMINNSGFTLKAGKTEGDNLTAADLANGEMINPGDTITMKAGKNMSVKHEKDGSITYATKDDVSFNTVNVGDNTYVDESGKPVTKDGDKYKDAEGNPVDAAKVTKLSPVAMKAEKAKPATNNGNETKDQPTTALNVSSSDGKPTQITGVGSTLNVKPVDTNPNGTPTTGDARPNLVDLVGTKDAPVNKNAAATVGDLQNMGWVVSAKDNNYTNTVKNANKVEFKGDNGISVTGKDVTQADGTVTREITVAIADGKVTDKVTITKDGKDIPAVKIGDNYYEVDKNGKPVGYEVDEKRKPTANNKPIDVAGATITNEGNKVVTGNTVATAIQESGWNVGLADSSKASAAFSDKDKALSADKLEKVNPNDNVRFADGKGTKAAVATVERVDEFGKKVTDTYVKFDIDTADVTNNANGTVNGPVTAEMKKALDEAKKALADLPANATPEAKKAAEDKVNAAQANINKVGNPVATAQNVAEAINNSGWRTNSTTATGGAKDTLINPGKAVNFESGKNMEVAQTVDKDGNVAYTYKTKDDVQFNSVQFGDANGPKITNNGGNINVSGADGKAPTKITGVAAGDISPNSTDAVNGAQIYALVGDQSNVNQTSPTYTKVDLDENGKPSYTTVNAPAGKTVVTAKDDNGHDVPVLKTYNVHSQKEIVTNSVVEAIHNMNEQGIKFFHSNDGVERPKQEQTNSFDSSASGKFATAIGSRSKANGTNAVAIGFNSVVTGNDSISIGTGNRVTGNNSGAFGDPSTVSGQGSYSVGNNNTVATNDTFVLGNEVKHTVENSAILGAKSTARGGNGSKTGTLRNLRQDGTQGASTTAGSTGTVSTATVGHMTYGGFQGDKADGVVSVGAAGNERRIQNVAAGEISKTSTDAINGSQLYAVAAGIGHKLGDLDNKINKVGKRGDAGTASALAAANIPQAYTPGKSLVGIAAGSYQGQNGLAVGMSRISDNGKIIIRLSGTANSQGKTGVAAGVGYQW